MAKYEAKYEIWKEDSIGDEDVFDRDVFLFEAKNDKEAGRKAEDYKKKLESKFSYASHISFDLTKRVG